MRKPDTHSVHEPEVHFSFAEIRSAAHDLADQRRKARHEYEEQIKIAADAERNYRKKLAIEETQFRADGKAQDESILLAKGEAADLAFARDIAQGMAKAALLRIEELEADRAMLRQLGDWSKDLEAIG